MRVLNVISDTNFGGAGRVLLNYLKNKSPDIYVAVAMPQKSVLKDRVRDIGVDVIEIDAMRDKSLDASAISKLMKVIHSGNFDVVHSHASMSARIAGRLCGKKVVYTRHSVFDNPPYKKSFPYMLFNRIVNGIFSDAIIAVSPAAAENIIEVGVNAKKIKIVFNGVEEVKAPSTERVFEMKKRFNICDDDFVLSIIARVEEVKGHLTILEAIEKTKDSHPGIKLIIAGTGGFEETVKSEIGRRNLSSNVVFAGFVDDVSALLGITDIQLNASYGTEATSMALLEGFSMGIPAVVSDFGGNPYVVTDGKNGLIFKKHDAAGLAECILKIKKDESLRLRLEEGAREEFYSRFTARVMAENIEAVYKEIIGGKKGDR